MENGRFSDDDDQEEEEEDDEEEGGGGITAIGEGGLGAHDDEDEQEVLLARTPATSEYGRRAVVHGRMNERLKVALLSQVLAMLLTLASISVQSLADAHVNLPGTLNSLAYGVLCLVYLPWYARKLLRARRQRLLGPDGDVGGGGGGGGGGGCDDIVRRGGRWKYPLLAFCDVEANFIIVFAYSYTSITSVTLLDFSTIPFAMILTRIFLHTRYAWAHVAGASTCVLGLAVLVLADMTSGGALEAGSRPILGDTMVVVSALLYSSSNIIEEDLLRRGAERGEVLALLPLLALPLATMQAYAFEHGRWAVLASGGRALVWVAGYVTSIVSFYSIAPYVLRRGGSAAFNLAMITSDLWAALAKVVMFGGFGTVTLAVAFFVSLLLVTIGLVVYARAGDVVAGDVSNTHTPEKRTITTGNGSGGGEYGSLRKDVSENVMSTPMRTISS